MKLFLTKIIFLLMFSNVSIGQSIEIIKGENFQGAIFPSTYKNKAYIWLDDSYRFTPTAEEILIFENNL